MTGDGQERWMQAQEEYERSLDGRGAARFVGLLVFGALVMLLVFGGCALTWWIG